MGRLTKRLHHARDLTRRWTRRGVARAVLEHRDHAEYLETHPIAAEMANTYGLKKIERFATQQNFEHSSAVTTFGMEIDPSHPNAAAWP